FRSALGRCNWTGEFQWRNRNCTAVDARSTCKANRFPGGCHGSVDWGQFDTPHRRAQRDWQEVLMAFMTARDQTGRSCSESLWWHVERGLPGMRGGAARLGLKKIGGIWNLMALVHR